MAKRMSLSNVKKELPGAPFRELVYGVEGVGKSSFGADAPSPVFLASERGTRHLDVPRFPQPTSFADVIDATRELEGEHPYKTLVIDTADWIEPLVHAEVAGMNKATGKPRSIEDIPYGKGYKFAEEKWRELLARLDALGRRGLNVIVLAHAQEKKVSLPTGESFSRWTLKLNEKASAVLKEWAESVLFANYDISVQGGAAGTRARGFSSGARYLYTTWNAAFDAKNRYGLPDKLPLSWDEFEAATKRGDRVGALRREIAASVEAIRDAQLAQVMRDTAEKATSEHKLREIANRIRFRLEEQSLEARDDESPAADATSPTGDPQPEAPAAPSPPAQGTGAGPGPVAAPAAASPSNSTAAGEAGVVTTPAPASPGPSLAPNPKVDVGYATPAEIAAENEREDARVEWSAEELDRDDAREPEPVKIPNRADVLARIGAGQGIHYEKLVKACTQPDSPDEITLVIGNLLAGLHGAEAVTPWWVAAGGSGAASIIFNKRSRQKEHVRKVLTPRELLQVLASAPALPAEASKVAP